MTDSLDTKLPTSLIPANEPERLAALYRYDILDTSAEVAFDRVTSLAARLFQMPTVLISLVDESRAWFKSSIGFDASEVPRDATICSFAVLTDEPLIVPDTQLDERFACKPFVLCEPGLRFYAGAPLISHDGFNLGTLCLLDTVPHDPLTAEQQATLVDLAAIVIDELELRLAAQQIARVDAALQEITRGLSTVTGEAFIDALVQHLAKVLNTDYAYIGLIEGDDPKMMRTIATCSGGEIVDNLEYPLKDTPCWEVLEQRKICYYSRNVQSYFPNAPLLKPLVVESYAATPFYNARGEVLGVLAVMDGKPLQDVNLVESLLSIFSDRIATEIERQQAEDSLQKLSGELERQLQRFDSVASSVPDFIYTFDLSGRFTYANQPLLDLWQQSLDQAVGKNFHELDYPPELADRLQAQIQQVIATQQPLKDESPYTSFLGTRAYEYVFVSLFSKDGAVEGVAGITRDVTDRKEAELTIQASEQRYRALIDVTTQIVWSADKDGMAFTSNLGAFTGQSFEEFQGWGWLEAIHPDDRQRTSEVWSLALANLTPYEIEHRMRRWDGEYRLMSARAVPLLNNDGIVHEWVGMHTDITEVRQDEQNLRRSEEFNRRILENNQDCIKVIDLDGRLLYMNDNGHKLLEIDDFAQYDRSLWTQFWGGSEQEQAQAAFVAAKAGTTSKFEGRCPTAKGTSKWWEVNVIPLHDEDGNVEQILVISHDLTERRQAEDELRQSQVLAQRQLVEIEAIYQTAPIGMTILDADLRFQRVNQRMAEMNGITIANHMGRTVREVVPDLADENEPLLRRVLETGEPVLNLEISGETIAKPGIYRTWISNFYPLMESTGQTVGINVVVQEITDRKQQELNNNFLAEIQKDLASIKDINQMLNVVGEKIRAWFGFWMLAFSDVDLATNTCTTFHTSSENGTLTQVADYSLSDFFSENHLQQLQAGETVAINDVYEDSGIKDQGSAYEAYPVRSLLVLSHIINEEWKFLMSGGRRETCIWREDELELMSELMPRIYLEIERSRSEAALEELNQRFEAAMDAVDGIIFEWNLDTNFVFRSKGLFNLIGVEAEDATPTCDWWFNLIHPEDQPNIESFFAQIEPNNDRYQFEYRVRHADGHWIDVWERGYVRRNGAGEIVNVIGFTSDISDLKQLEKELEERNQELIRFSYIVSHDLKAPLRGISNLAAWISEDLPATIDPDILANLELMRSRVSRMDNLIDGLLDYAKLGNTEASLETFSVEQLLAEIVDLLSIPDSFVVELPAELPPLTTNRVLLSQVLANLIGNAYKHHDSPDGRIQVTVQPDAKMWRFSVTDDGRGIAPENQERVFDIFKTLLGADKNNTGIGLSIVKKLVETQGGKITLESQLGMGTTFSFTWMAEIEGQK